MHLRPRFHLLQWEAGNGLDTYLECAYGITAAYSQVRW